MMIQKDKAIGDDHLDILEDGNTKWKVCQSPRTMVEERGRRSKQNEAYTIIALCHFMLCCNFLNICR